jgi:RNA polymerase sigma factor (sigma-70 family)
MNGFKPERSDESIPTRLSLLERLKNRDDSLSWRGFFETYWRLIYNVARKSGLSEHEAEEVVQETVIGVSRNIEHFNYDPNRGSFKSWLLQMTRWRILDQLKNRRREQSKFVPLTHAAESNEHTSAVEAISSSNSFGMSDLWEKEWRNNLLEAALERIREEVSPRHFQVYYFHVIQEESVRTVCRMFGVNTAQVYLIKHRISALLKKEVKRLEKAWTS